MPAGAMTAFAGSSVPTGWLLCSGSPISRTEYSALFAAIGTTWGAGDGSTTFNVPNMARRAAVGSGGTGTGTLGNSVGNVGGAETHTLTSAQMPAHNHSQFGSTDSGAITAGAAIGDMSVIPTGNAGSGSAHNNLQPSAVVLYIIKT